MTKVLMTVTDDKLVLLRKKMSKIKDVDDVLKMYEFVSDVFNLQKRADRERKKCGEKRKRLLMMKKDYLEAYQDFMDGMEGMKAARNKYSDEDEDVKFLTRTMDARKEDLELLAPFVDKAFFYTKKLKNSDLMVLSVPREDSNGETRYSEYEIDVAAKPFFQTAHGKRKDVCLQRLKMDIKEKKK